MMPAPFFQRPSSPEYDEDPIVIQLRPVTRIGWRMRLAVTLCVGVLVILFFYAVARAQELHQHPSEIITERTAKFYETWFRPDAPTVSCCNMQDCYATKVKMGGRTVFAWHRESDEFIVVPPEKIDQFRVSPDGLSHICASSAKFVFCFVFGGGT